MCVRAAVSHSVIIENACRSLYNVIDVFACGSDILKVIAHKFNDIFAWTNTCTWEEIELFVHTKINRWKVW